jgi:glycosyltransferase involved in cell wall biosynthesis
MTGQDELTRPIAIDWEPSQAHGWGQVGLHICLELLRRGEMPLLPRGADVGSMRPEVRQRLEPLLVGRAAQATSHDGALPPGCVILTPFGNGLGPIEPYHDAPGTLRVGIGAFEETRFTNDARTHAARFARLIVHSRWGYQVLAAAGIPGAIVALQGIDPEEIYPLPRTGRFPGRFVVFSGGKLEFRKGQDIVLAAFRRFLARYPEALLVATWHSPRPQAAETFAMSSLVPGAPELDAAGRMDLTAWAAANGVPRHSFFDTGFLTRDLLPHVFAECDLAVFPNRCEGATNLVAMEAMAAGVPVVLSANTGHLDLIRPGICHTLDTQRPVRGPRGGRSGWGESSVDELLARMETVRAMPVAARQTADYAMHFIRTERTWSRFAAQVVDEIRAIG